MNSVETPQIITLDEKQYLLNLLDSQISWIKDNYNHCKTWQFNAAILIGTILSGSFGALLVSAAQSMSSDQLLPSLSTSAKGVGLAALFFILLSAINYFYRNFFSFFKFIKIIKDADSEEIENIIKLESAEVPKMHHAFKPFIIIFFLSLICSIITFLSLPEHSFFTIGILILSIILILQVIQQYIYSMKKGEKTIRGIASIVKLKRVPRGEVASAFAKFFAEKPKKGIVILLLLLILPIIALPSFLAILFSSFLILSHLDILSSSFLLVSIVTFLQIILIYPVQKYFNFEMLKDILSKQEKYLFNLRKDIILNNKSYLNYLELYKNYLTKFDVYNFNE